MLRGITQSMRFWAAIVLVAGYLVALLAPSAALAFGDAPCPPEKDHSSVTTHLHQDSTSHGHAGRDGMPADDGAAAVKCCGLVFASAIAPQTDVILTTPVEFGRTSFAIVPAIAGLSPEGLKRPPKA